MAISLEEFASKLSEMLSDRLSSDGEKWDIQYDRKAMQLSLLNADGRLVASRLLAPYYHDYVKADETAAEAKLQSLIASLCKATSLPNKYNWVLPLLDARMVSLWEVYKLNRRMSKLAVGERLREPDSVPYLQVSEHLALIAFVNAPGRTYMVTNRAIKNWGVTDKQIFEDAISNLRDITDGARLKSKSDKKGTLHYYQSAWHFGDHAARLVIDDLVTAPVAGEPIYLPVSEKCLIIAGSDSTIGMERLKTALVDVDATLPPIPLVRKDGRFEAWQPAADSEFAPLIRRYTLEYMAKIYAEQRPILFEIVADEMDETFVAAYDLQEDKKGGLITSAMVTEGVPVTLVPEVERLSFMHVNVSTQSGQVMASGTWAAVAAVLGDKIESTDFYPRRFCFVGFPSPEELKKIGINE
ncbi:MAG: hypothetical protein JSS86_05110 [Cyanobacteria bacterium SZAS LIN-2]|nr:hypothetical protein [Cyanobacteria bacterium SZAS LIN-2]